MVDWKYVCIVLHEGWLDLLSHKVSSPLKSYGFLETRGQVAAGHHEENLQFYHLYAPGDMEIQSFNPKHNIIPI